MLWNSDFSVLWLVAASCTETSLLTSVSIWVLQWYNNDVLHLAEANGTWFECGCLASQAWCGADMCLFSSHLHSELWRLSFAVLYFNLNETSNETRQRVPTEWVSCFGFRLSHLGIHALGELQDWSQQNCYSEVLSNHISSRKPARTCWLRLSKFHQIIIIHLLSLRETKQSYVENSNKNRTKCRTASFMVIIASAICIPTTLMSTRKAIA